ncbi:transglutaminase domain-containing protein [Candidatus Magnetobacterium casense]|uniref:Transglutaminase family protein n=1 Tax=Candidatus Magnetobacterium casense TaxID=1455061 RepID=A0ABS6RU94_9BACT|nr:transglutaminase family protein [Candidatus Magnetobacterium casensis]MBV6340204.1 transglutaminase family protein [Candidatus Magnetobacterium casensis]
MKDSQIRTALGSLSKQNISRRAFLAGAVAAAGYMLTRRLDNAAAAQPAAADTNITKIKSLTYKIEYLTEFLTSSSNDSIRLWLPLPVEEAQQVVTNLSIESKYPYTVNRASDNGVVFIETKGIRKGRCAALHYTVKRNAAGITDCKGDDALRYLQLSEWEKWDGEIAKYVDAAVGPETDPARIGRILYDGIIDRTTYVHKLCSRGVSTLAFEDKAGRCDDFHALFRTMMVYKKIPVKWDQGIMLPYRAELNKKGTIEADCINSHSWLKFYAGGKCIPVDISEAKRWPALREFYFGSLTANRIMFSCGRGLTLLPPQAEILNNFSYTHAEANGIPMIYGHNYRTFIRYELIRKEI